MSSFYFFLVISLITHDSCNSVPILPILTAIAGSGSNVLNVDIDALGITKWMSETIKIKKNRSGFVKDLMYTAFYKSDQKYNVLVFNLNEEHRHRLQGIQFYASAEYTDGTMFGVWLFEQGFFINKGARGWNNWAMMGTFSKNKQGNIITFRKRVVHDNSVKDQLNKQDNSNKIPDLGVLNLETDCS